MRFVRCINNRVKISESTFPEFIVELVLQGRTPVNAWHIYHTLEIRYTHHLMKIISTRITHDLEKESTKCS